MAVSYIYGELTLHHGGGLAVQLVEDGVLPLHQGGGLAYSRARDGDSFLHPRFTFLEVTN